MLTLVIGGAASGKSQFAEDLVLQAGNLPRYYVATMEPFDEECRKRIQRHREMRREKNFETLECFTNLSQVKPSQKGVVLLEDLSNLAANERYSPKGAGEQALEAVCRGLEALESRCAHLIVVSNEIFCGGKNYAGDTLAYLKLLAMANRLAAAKADRVYEVVCGVPVLHKGGNENDIL